MRIEKRLFLEIDVVKYNIRNRGEANKIIEKCRKK